MNEEQMMLILVVELLLSGVCLILSTQKSWHNIFYFCAAGVITLISARRILFIFMYRQFIIWKLFK